VDRCARVEKSAEHNDGSDGTEPTAEGPWSGDPSRIETRLIPNVLAVTRTAHRRGISIRDEAPGPKPLRTPTLLYGRSNGEISE
jgi:hypothetical protein